MFLASYHGNRYHLSIFNNPRLHRYSNPRDLYNHRHAQLRNYVEKAFGILKKQFKILRTAIPFSFKIQKRIVMACCCIIHNFIRHNEGNDKYFNMSLAPMPPDNDEDDIDPFVIVKDDECHRGEELHNSIVNRLWRRHNQQGMFNSST